MAFFSFALVSPPVFHLLARQPEGGGAQWHRLVEQAHTGGLEEALTLGHGVGMFRAYAYEVRRQRHGRERLLSEKAQAVAERRQRFVRAVGKWSLKQLTRMIARLRPDQHPALAEWEAREAYKLRERVLYRGVDVHESVVKWFEALRPRPGRYRPYTNWDPNRFGVRKLLIKTADMTRLEGSDCGLTFPEALYLHCCLKAHKRLKRQLRLDYVCAICPWAERWQVVCVEKGIAFGRELSRELDYYDYINLLCLVGRKPKRAAACGVGNERPYWYEVGWNGSKLEWLVERAYAWKLRKPTDYKDLGALPNPPRVDVWLRNGQIEPRVLEPPMAGDRAKVDTELRRLDGAYPRWVDNPERPKKRRRKKAKYKRARDRIVWL